MPKASPWSSAVTWATGSPTTPGCIGPASARQSARRGQALQPARRRRARRRQDHAGAPAHPPPCAARRHGRRDRPQGRRQVADPPAGPPPPGPVPPPGRAAAPLLALFSFCDHLAERRTMTAETRAALPGLGVRRTAAERLEPADPEDHRAIFAPTRPSRSRSHCSYPVWSAATLARCSRMPGCASPPKLSLFTASSASSSLVRC